MKCELLSAAALVLSLYAIFRSKEVKIEVVETKLAKKRKKRIKRYVSTVVISEDPKALEEECLEEAVKETLRRAYGTVGLAVTDLKLAYFDRDAGVAIFRVTLEGVKLLASALMWLEEACGTKVNLVPVRAFGTLSSAREKVPKLSKYVKELE